MKLYINACHLLTTITRAYLFAAGRLAVECVSVSSRFDKMARGSVWRCYAQVALTVLLAARATALALPGDNLQIESRVMEVRAEPLQSMDLDTAATGDHHHHHHHHGHHGDHHDTHGGGKHGGVGYLRTKDSKGDRGYQKFDSFHKKNGDSYGFETHSAFGKASKKDYGDHEGAGTEGIERFVGFGGDGGHFSEHYTSGGDGGDGGHYSSGEGGDGHYSSGGDGDSGGKGGHYSEHFSSEGDGDGSHAGYTSGGDSDFHGFHDGEFH